MPNYKMTLYQDSALKLCTKQKKFFGVQVYLSFLNVKLLKVEIPELDGDDAVSDAESAKSVRMEMVEVIKLHMSLDLPEGRNLILIQIPTINHNE